MLFARATLDACVSKTQPSSAPGAWSLVDLYQNGFFSLGICIYIRVLHLPTTNGGSALIVDEDNDR